MLQPKNETTKVIEVRNVSVEYAIPNFKISTLKEFVLAKLSRKLSSTTFRAVNSVSFDVYKGESVAIIGHNGSGKSTMLRTLAGIIEPPNAHIKVVGRVAPMIELGAGFDGDLNGYENIKLSCLLMGLSLKEIKERTEDIIAFSELGHFINMPIKNYSSGMYARLGFACATAVDPDILLVDEILAVGDSNFAIKCLARIEHLRSLGTSVVLVSHSPDMIQRFCERAIVFNQGSLVFDGPVKQALEINDEVMRTRLQQSQEAAAQ